MTATNRAGLIGKLHTALKKHYKPTPTSPGRPLLEHVLYAALLEEAPVDLADEAFAKCEQEFFDWNEVRVTSITELAEVLAHLPAPANTAVRLKRCLQGTFEAFYAFDIDQLKKENLGKAVAKFESMSGITPFVLAYLVQHGLGGHAIPVNGSALRLMLVCGIISPQEAAEGRVPGLERAIPKNKAIDFSSMLHQCSIALATNPKDATVHQVILAVNKQADLSALQPAAKSRPSRKSAAATATSTPAKSKAPAKAEHPSSKAAPGKSAATNKSKSAKATPTKKAAPKTKAAKAKPTNDKAKSGDAARSSKPAAKKTTPSKKAGDKAKPAKKSPSHPAAPSTSQGTGKPKSNKGKPPLKVAVVADGDNQNLTKRKPR